MVVLPQAKEKPLLSSSQKRKKLQWAMERLKWSKSIWSMVIFSDESTFQVSPGDTRRRIIRTKEEAFHPDCLERSVKHAASLMVWGCIGRAGTGQLHFIHGNVNAFKYQDILRMRLLPSIDTLRPLRDVIFQQDGATCHTAKTTKRWLAEHQIETLPWPSNSPDLSPIENVWGIITNKPLLCGAWLTHLIRLALWSKSFEPCDTVLIGHIFDAYG